MNLPGRFFFRSGKEYSSSGEVMREAAPGVMFVRFDRIEEDGARAPSESMVMIKVDDMVSGPKAIEEMDIEWHFFDSREELNGFLRFIDDIDEKVDEADKLRKRPRVN